MTLGSATKESSSLFPGTLWETFALRYIFSIDAPASFKNNGVLQVYFRPSENAGERVYPLPVASYDGIINMQLESFDDETFAMLIFQELRSTAVDEIVDEDIASIRYVIIPGGTEAGRGVSVDLRQYEKVRQYYGIPE